MDANDLKMRRFRIRYRDLDGACPVFSCTVKGYDRDHALERFFDEPGDDDWKILSVKAVA